MNKVEIERAISMAPHGKQRMILLRKAWEIADQEKDYDGQIKYRMDYMHESCFYDDEMEIYIIYPEILKLHDQRLKECGHDSNTADILWKYKWLLENAKDFYQISVRQYEMFWQDAKKRYQQNGYSLRPLYQHRFIFYLNIDIKEAAEAYKEFVNCQRDRISDCHACERSSEVDYFLASGDLGRAVSKAEPLVDGRLSCAEQPECTFGSFLRYYNEEIIKGDRDYVEPASELCETLKKSIDRKGIATFHIPDVLMYYALENPTKALNYYKKHWSFPEENRNPTHRFWFAIATLRFLKNLGEKKTYKMTMSPSFPFYRADDTYDVEMLRKYYRDIALDVAEKVDKRNGTTVYRDTFNKMLQIEQ